MIECAQFFARRQESMFALIRLILLIIIILSVALFVRPDLLEQFGITKLEQPGDTAAEMAPVSDTTPAAAEESGSEIAPAIAEITAHTTEPVAEPPSEAASEPASGTAMESGEVPAVTEDAAAEAASEMPPEPMPMESAEQPTDSSGGSVMETLSDQGTDNGIPTASDESVIEPAAVETPLSVPDETVETPINDIPASETMPATESSAGEMIDADGETESAITGAADMSLEEEAALIESIMMKEISETFDAGAVPTTSE